MLLSLALAFLSVPTAVSSTSDGSAPDLGTAGVPIGFWWADFDADGLQDAFAIDMNGAPRLLRNQGDGSFVDVTRVSGLDALSATRFASWQDFDRDGAPDLFVGSRSGPGRLLRNARDGTFQDWAPVCGCGAAKSAPW